MRVFLDANVLFSAAHRADRAMHAWMRLADSGICTLIASPFAIDEARRNLARKHPSALGRLEDLLERLEVCNEAGTREVEAARQIGLPAKDAPILAAAALAKADLLVTGDRTHFGFLYGKTPLGVTVLPPRAAIEGIVSVPGGR